MKKSRSLTIASISTLAILFLLLFVAARTDGGKRYNRRNYNNLFEQNHNLMYRTVHDTFTYTDRRGKPRQETRDIDIAIYHYNNDSISYLFNHNNTDRIVHLYYEASYDSVKHRIKMESFDRYDSWTANEENIQPRKPSDNVLVVTQNEKTKMYSLWRAHKTGINLERLKRYKSSADLVIDPFNQKVMVVRTEPRKLVVMDFDY